jgi:hypothetical protein
MAAPRQFADVFLGYAFSRFWKEWYAGYGEPVTDAVS